MLSGKSVLAIIPAREGSRRCPEKNWTIYKNKTTGELNSLVGWAINHAKGSRYIDTIAIASDSQLILNYATPPLIPIRLPKYIADGTSEAAIVFTLYSTSTLREDIVGFHDLICLLQPTSPNRSPEDIDATLDLASKAGHAAVSVDSSGRRNGAVYALHTHLFLAKLSIDAGAARYVMPDSRSLDIDEPADFTR